MGEIHPPIPVTLFVGILTSDPPLIEEIEGSLEKLYGPVTYKSPLFPSDHTRYYEEEMGPGLIRCFLFFEEPISPDRLSVVKRQTQEMEKSCIEKGDRLRRRINLDPGYLHPAKIVLASTKDFSHRVYLGEGVYGEVTLYFQGKSFHPMPHTYPDFRKPERIALFNEIRGIRLRRLSGNSPETPPT